MVASPGVGVSRYSASRCQRFSPEATKKVSARFRRNLLTLVIVPWLFAQASLAQVSTGTPPFGSFGGGPFDTVNLGNLNVHFAIPVIRKAGRGMPFTYDLSYDTSRWSPVDSSGNKAWTPVPNWGWRGVTEVATGYVSIQGGDGGVDSQGCNINLYSFPYHDPLGVTHNLWPTLTSHIGGHQCIGIQPTLPHTITATDGSGYSLTVTSLAGAGTLTSRSGKVITPPFTLLRRTWYRRKGCSNRR